MSAPAPAKFTPTDVVASAEQLRALVGEPSERAAKKVLPALDEHCRAFIARSPFCLIGTSSATHGGDVSPKGDAPGFVRVIDDRTLVLPDRHGNRRVDSWLNVVENPTVGLLFIVPGVEETLRINGDAVLSCDPRLLETTAVDGKPPLLCLVVSVNECFIHCAKAFKRSKLWEPESWPERDELPSMARLMVDHTRASCSLDEMEAGIRESYALLY